MAANTSFYLFAFSWQTPLLYLHPNITYLLRKPRFILNTTAVIKTFTDSIAAAVGVGGGGEEKGVS